MRSRGGLWAACLCLTAPKDSQSRVYLIQLYYSIKNLLLLRIKIIIIKKYNTIIDNTTRKVELSILKYIQYISSRIELAKYTILDLIEYIVAYIAVVIRPCMGFIQVFDAYPKRETGAKEEVDASKLGSPALSRPDRATITDTNGHVGIRSLWPLWLPATQYFVLGTPEHAARPATNHQAPHPPCRIGAENWVSQGVTGVIGLGRRQICRLFMFARLWSVGCHHRALSSRQRAVSDVVTVKVSQSPFQTAAVCGDIGRNPSPRALRELLATGRDWTPTWHPEEALREHEVRQLEPPRGIADNKTRYVQYPPAWYLFIQGPNTRAVPQDFLVVTRQSQEAIVIGTQLDLRDTEGTLGRLVLLSGYCTKSRQQVFPGHFHAAIVDGCRPAIFLFSFLKWTYVALALEARSTFCGPQTILSSQPTASPDTAYIRLCLNIHLTLLLLAAQLVFLRRNSPGAAELVRPYVTNRPKSMNGQNARIFTILHNNNASTYLDALAIRHHVAHSISDSMHGCTTDVPNPVVVEAVRRSGLITDSQHKVQSPFAHAVAVQTAMFLKPSSVYEEAVHLECSCSKTDLTSKLDAETSNLEHPPPHPMMRNKHSIVPPALDHICYSPPLLKLLRFGKLYPATHIQRVASDEDGSRPIRRE
ncbi:hypothetical protein QBC37DRAFT_401178 [Rhypophila decipiens]|uniref:Uncharacterized protein n=1 Tax=Rhypophila decipiens TaxID=261697 RepID=A0AAN6Y605_9PEZI|nr:hypothetical protein QBC37DRAFT_401178 [Rhypophila decipiens]